MLDNFFPPAIPTPADAPQTSPPLILLTMNVAPSTELHQDAKSNAKSTQAPDKLKTKILHLPHPSSLDVLPSPTDKWSATTLVSLTTLAITSLTNTSTSTRAEFFTQKPSPQALLPPPVATAASPKVVQSSMQFMDTTVP